MFKFNFALPNDEGVDTPAPAPATAESAAAAPAEDSSVSAANCPPARECVAAMDVAVAGHHREIEAGELKLRIGSQTSLSEYNDSPLSQLLKTTDIQDGVYEGGLKVWECSLDLVTFMQVERRKKEEDQSSAETEVEGSQRVAFELGCGHGLPGIQALLHGFDEVYFMDMNHEVLSSATVVNVALNCEPRIAERSRYFSGDWEDVSELLRSQDSTTDQANLILSAETIYTELVTAKLCKVLYRHLAYPNGEALIAAKRYYFGCGGGTDAFKQALETPQEHNENVLHGETVWASEDGKSNTREIVRVRWAANK